jgi:hypothetical protein
VSARSEAVEIILVDALKRIERLYLNNVGKDVTAEMFIEGARIAHDALVRVGEAR